MDCVKPDHPLVDETGQTLAGPNQLQIAATLLRTLRREVVMPRNGSFSEVLGRCRGAGMSMLAGLWGWICVELGGC